MGIRSRLYEQWYRVTGQTELAEQLRASQAMTSQLAEGMADLERRMYDPGWQRMLGTAEQEFTREGLRQIASVSRLMAIKNPLIRRGLALRYGYVWGQGVEVTARATGNDEGEQDVNATVARFLTDPSNLRTFSGAQARETNERALGTDGSVFYALFTSPKTGRVQVRTLPYDEIVDIITNPDDVSEPWFYRREWTTATGTSSTTNVVLYPALGHRPNYRPHWEEDQFGQTVRVRWDAPVYHLRVNAQLGWKYGLGDAYAAIDWAYAYRDFLTDWARLVKSLSRFAWRLTSKGSKQAAARSALSALPSRTASGESNWAGATASLPTDMSLEAVPKSGATIDSESGRPLAAMVAAAMDVPVTMLLGDPGTVGARATAETLDEPTRLAMEGRRAIHTAALMEILQYVITEAVRAPAGQLHGSIVVDADGIERLSLDGDTDTTIDVVWPSLTKIDPTSLVTAIVEADTTGYLPPLVVVRLLLQALGVRDIDSIITAVTGDDGEWEPPGGEDGAIGQALMARFRKGGDPAALLNPDAETEPEAA
ncbi:hypothetical protein EDD29_0070 [Actinocorallia herbida]|uniref:SPP1 Gp6-like portal protein n=1 Tax=Actinocorallia herbida TaxID=58109 RepID=A0A3N1CMR0_9ACTN|nr:hypothetical protein [Actinocorallia herbida]ROO82590.1 hypothetical protein EDD29_0070 [Actinocorallia herbida]